MALDRVRADLPEAVVESFVTIVGFAAGLWMVVVRVAQNSGIQVPDLENFLVERQIRQACRPRSAVPC